MRRLPNHRSEKATSYEFALANRERVKGSPSERRHTTTTFAPTIRLSVDTFNLIRLALKAGQAHLCTRDRIPFDWAILAVWSASFLI
jgi:hypothetical protein